GERVLPRGADDPWAGQSRIDGVKLVIAVASGKGGVGKSTVAVNLSLALRSQGLQVGLLDADIYGPSAPTMLGIRSIPQPDRALIKPAESYGIKVISIGFFIPPDAPLIWRGPMVMKAVDQFLHEVTWAPLDVLVVDLPPGTGDAQLTLAQRVPVDGAVIVTTSSDVALIDARKAIQMFHKVNVPVLGIVENMSYFICPHCQNRTDIFSSGKGLLTARQLGVDFLGEIPLDPTLRQAMDEGKPVVGESPDSPPAQAFLAIARKVWDKITTMYPQWQLNACHILV
ncbi:MAG: Mrp/NBP35 family ATP-binding protein, partial [bacterium]